jgi:hypothetical protein
VSGFSITAFCSDDPLVDTSMAPGSRWVFRDILRLAKNLVTPLRRPPEGGSEADMLKVLAVCRLEVGKGGVGLQRRGRTKSGGCTLNYGFELLNTVTSYNDDLSQRWIYMHDD